MTEAEFLRRLRENPDDLAAMHGYLAQLDAAGDERASALRLISARRELEINLQVIKSQIAARSLDPEWLDIVAPLRIRSPEVGRVYLQPTPGEGPYVSVGGHVTRGQLVAMIESMKLFSELFAECDGIITDILVTNGQAIEFNQDLFRIRRMTFDDYW